MELVNEFVVPVGIEEAWALLTDVERIAPCMPGAQLQEIEGEEYRGVVKVKVGPVTAQYKGKATIVQRDEAARKVVLKAEGRDSRGAGNASALITATLAGDGDKTSVKVVTDLTITGKAAQFGRGVLADVSTKLIGQFTSCLETTVLSGDSGAPQTETPAEAEAGGDGAPAAATSNGAATAEASSGPRQVNYAPVEPVDVLGSNIMGPVLKRLVPTVLAALLALVVVRKIFRRRRA